MFKEQSQLKENITMVKVVDETIVNELSEAVKNNEPLDKFIERGQITEVFEKQNIIVDAGLNVLMKLLAGDTSNTGEINYGALGDGTVAPSASDTKMENEIYRKLASSSSYDGKVAYVDFFYEKADTSGTFTKFANFIDGLTGKDTGVMWSHIGVNWVKTLNDGLFVACRYTISYKV